eukprot:5113052-Alexandrium_andersonii.AAC.1
MYMVVSDRKGFFACSARLVPMAVSVAARWPAGLGSRCGGGGGPAEEAETDAPTSGALAWGPSGVGGAGELSSGCPSEARG